MNLIRENEDMVLPANLHHLGQLLAGPDPAHWVMGTAQDEHCRIGLLSQSFKLLKVNGVIAVFFHQPIDLLHAAIVADASGKRVVDRGLDDDPVARLGELLDRSIDCRNDTHAEKHPFRFGPPMVMAMEPADGSFTKRVVCKLAGIAEDTVSGALFDCLDHFIRAPEIHVGDPHGQCLSGIDLIAGEPALIALPLRAEGTAAWTAVNDLIKIVSHFLTLLYFTNRLRFVFVNNSCPSSVMTRVSSRL